jgi:hypothetical protein
MRQPRELRGERRRHAIAVKLLAQPKTTGSLIQRHSLRGTVTTSGEPAMTTVANQQTCSTKPHGLDHGSAFANARSTTWTPIGTNEFGAHTHCALGPSLECRSVERRVTSSAGSSITAVLGTATEVETALPITVAKKQAVTKTGRRFSWLHARETPLVISDPVDGATA